MNMNDWDFGRQLGMYTSILKRTSVSESMRVRDKELSKARMRWRVAFGFSGGLHGPILCGGTLHVCRLHPLSLFLSFYFYFLLFCLYLERVGSSVINVVILERGCWVAANSLGGPLSVFFGRGPICWGRCTFMESSQRVG